MELTISQEPGYTLAKIRGPIDESTDAPFREQLHPLVGERGARLVLDLSGAPRVNSIGISHLVRLVSDANTNGSRVILAGATPFVASVISVTRLDRFFDLTADVPAAVVMLGTA